MEENIKLRYNFKLQKVGQTYIAVSVGEDAKAFPSLLYFNEVGAMICGEIMEETTRTAVLDKLCDTYDSSREELGACLDEVLQYLSETGVLIRQ